MTLTPGRDGHVEEPLKSASPGALGSRVARVETPQELPSRLLELGLRPPRPVVVLVGGAHGLDDARLARFRPLFEEGLAPLADSLGACVIDGAIAAGVMGLIGQARAKLGASFPLVGVAASGTVAPAHGAEGGKDTASLEPNHTHLVLVPGDTWGAESPWIAEVAALLAGDGPSVTVMVNGGDVTLDDAARSVDAGRPVLAVAGSGRAADELAAALMWPGQNKRVTKLARSGLVQAVYLDDGPQAIARAVTAVLTSARKGGPSAMPAAASASGRVFISYRRQETSGLAGRLYERLAARLGDDQVFMDVDTIAPGLDFAEVIAEAVSTCEVLLAVIGPTWLTATDEDGQRRLEDPDDIVRLEIAAALERNIRVIPILVEGAQMPRRQQLPEDLAKLARRNALGLRHESFRADADRLLTAIEPILRAAAPAWVASDPAQVVPEAVPPTDTFPLPGS
jgi:SLOG in TRPM, prokaryote/TIR domain